MTRFRESLQAGAVPQDAAATAMRTAGRTVLIAGTTVVIGMLGLLLLRQPLLNGVAVAAAATVAMTLAGSLTLLPALLGFTGTRLAGPPGCGSPKRGSPGWQVRLGGGTRRQGSAPAPVRPLSGGRA